MHSTQPFAISDDEALSLPLQPDDDLDVTGGEPHAFVRELYRDDDVEYGVWEVTPGGFSWENTGYGELMRVLTGDATPRHQCGRDDGRAGAGHLAGRAAGLARAVGRAGDGAQDLPRLEHVVAVPILVQVTSG